MDDYIAVKKRNPDRRVSLNNFFQGQNSAADESVLSLGTAKKIINFDFSSGALKEGYGLKASLVSAQNVTNVWEYRRYDFTLERDEIYLMYSDAAGEVYYKRIGGAETPFAKLGEVVFTSAPIAINYRLYGEDVIIMCSEKDGMTVWNGSDGAYKVEGAPHITSLALHFERLFATVDKEKNMVRFSDDLDPTNWGEDITEGGFIQMLDERGKLNKVISFLNYVYVFRDYGISRITAYADQNEFYASNLFVSSGKIYSKSVVPCGDTVLFMAGDGLYRFDGVSTTRLLKALDNFVLSSIDSCACYFEGKYYAAVKIDDGENTGGNNALLVYDIKTGNYTVSDGVKIVSLSVVNEELYCVLGSGRVGKVEKCGEMFGAPSKKVWESGMLDFGTDRKKRVKEFYIDADVPFTLRVFSEKGEQSFSLTPSEGLTKQKLNVTGQKIGFEISTGERTARFSRPGLIMSLI